MAGENEVGNNRGVQPEVEVVQDAPIDFDAQYQKSLDDPTEEKKRIDKRVAELRAKTGLPLEYFATINGAPYFK